MKSIGEKIDEDNCCYCIELSGFAAYVVGYASIGWKCQDVKVSDDKIIMQVADLLTFCAQRSAKIGATREFLGRSRGAG